MFTSRAEYRLLLRQDNADSRLMRRGHAFGLIPEATLRHLEEKERRVAEARKYLESERISPDEANESLRSAGSEPLTESVTLSQLLKRSEVTIELLLALPLAASDERMRILNDDRDARERVQIEVKYDGYLRRQEEQIRQFADGEQMEIPDGFDFHSLKSLSSEGKEKLQRVMPRSLGQASRISGVTPADISILMIALSR